MAELSQDRGVDVWTIRSADGTASASFVPEFGGVGSSLILQGPTGPRELLYLHDWFWDRDSRNTRGGWPFLFPNCGRVERGGRAGAYLYDGRLYTLGLHGFSMWLPWEVADSKQPDSITLRLKDSRETRRDYPFAFEVTLAYHIAPDALTCRFMCKNTGDSPMPYYAGFHPYLLTPPPDGGKELVTLSCPARRRMLYNPKLTDVVGSLPPPALPLRITDDGTNEMLLDVEGDCSFSLAFPDGMSLNAEVKSEPAHLFRFIQLYTMPDEPFFSAEPWMSHPNALNTLASARMLPPGQLDNADFTLSVRHACDQAPRQNVKTL